MQMRIVALGDFEELQHEHQVLLEQLARLQHECSGMVEKHIQRQRALESEIVRLRGRLITQETRLHFLREDLDRQSVRNTGADGVDVLGSLRLMQALKLKTVPMPPELGPDGRSAQADGKPRADEASIFIVASASAGQVQSQSVTLDESLFENEAKLAECLEAAELVICQTGCISHDGYWLVEGHCRRTGKQCMLIDGTYPLRFFPALEATAGGMDGS